MDSGRPVGVARRWNQALPAGQRQHGRPTRGLRGKMLAPLCGAVRLCRLQGANSAGRRVRFEAACWRGPAVESDFAGGAAPTWTAVSRAPSQIVGAPERCHKALPATRRQPGRPPGWIRGGLLAWPDGGIRLCRRGSANIGGRLPSSAANCWRRSAVL